MSGLPPKHGLDVTVSSGPNPKHGNPMLSMTAGQNPASAVRGDTFDSERFTRREIVSVRLVEVRSRPFSVVLSTDTPGAILIESVEVSVCEDDEPVFNIPVSAASVVLNKPGDSQVFRLTAQQLATVSEHLERGHTVKVRVRYAAAEESELKISIREKESHHKLPYILAIIAAGFGLQSVLSVLPKRSRPGG